MIPHSHTRRRLLAALGVLGLAPFAARGQINAGPYVPSPSLIVDRMLELGAIRKDDYLFDLGSGDGRIPITAAQRYGARGFGVDINADLVRLANENAARAGVADRVRFEKRDLFETSLAEATVVTVYLLPTTVTKLVPKVLAEMKPGARIVSHDYPLSPWVHDRHVQFDTEEKVPISGTTRTVLYLYTVPARVAGTWRLEPPGGAAPLQLVVAQHPVQTTATVSAGNRTTAVDDFSVKGETVRFTLPAAALGKPLVLEGRARGDLIEGASPSPWRATRTAPAKG